MKEFLGVYNTIDYPYQIKKIKAKDDDEAYDIFNDWLEDNMDQTCYAEDIVIIDIGELDNIETIEENTHRSKQEEQYHNFTVTESFLINNKDTKLILTKNPTDDPITAYENINGEKVPVMSWQPPITCSLSFEDDINESALKQLKLNELYGLIFVNKENANVFKMVVRILDEYSPKSKAVITSFPIHDFRVNKINKIKDVLLLKDVNFEDQVYHRS